MKKIKLLANKIFLWILYLFILLILINIPVNYLISQKNFPNFTNKFTFKEVHTLIAPDLQKESKINYLFIGDSYAQGAGDSYLNGDYNYSIPHRFSNEGINSINAGLGGASNLSAVLYAIQMAKVFEFSPFLDDFPKFDKVFVFFYEGNDLNNNLRHLNKNHLDEYETNKIKKSVNPSIWTLIKQGYFYGANFLRVNIHRPIKKIWDDLRGKESKNLLVNNIEINGKTYKTKHLQSAALELSDNELKNSFGILKKSLKLAKNNFKSDDYYLIYIPSPVTTYSFSTKEFVIQTYQDGRKNIPSTLNLLRSNFLRKNIKKIAENENFNFIDSTESLIRKAKTEPIHGPVDWSHLNQLGYDQLFTYIKSKI